MITCIAAVSLNWGIGKDNDLLFNIPEDKKFFRRTTLNHSVIMGRKTLLSLPCGKPFKDRNNIVLSRDEKFSYEGVKVCRSIEEALKYVNDEEEAFIVGGGSVYKDALPYCQKALITKIESEVPADTFFPCLDGSPEWKLTEESQTQEYEGLRYKFCTYERIV